MPSVKKRSTRCFIIVCTPALPDGYSFDYINAEILRHHSKIVDKQLVLESGMRYK